MELIKGDCTSFAAWRVNNRLGVPFSDYYKGPQWSHAKYWDDRARDVGIVVDHTPAVGAVAQWNSGTYGHVASVARIDTNGTVLLRETGGGHTNTALEQSKRERWRRHSFLIHPKCTGPHIL